MRIANIIEESRLGGPQIRMLRVAENLKKFDKETIIFMPKHNSEKFKKICKEKKTDFEILDICSIEKNYFKILKYILFFISDIFEVIKKIKSKKIDLIHISGGSWQIRGIIAGKILKKPIIWHINDTNMPKFILLIYKILYPLTTSIIYASKKSLSIYQNFDQKPYMIIPSTLDTIYFQKKNLIKTPIFNDYNKTLINVSNLSPVKNIACLLRCVSEIKKKISNIKLLIIGETFKSQLHYKKKILNLIDHLNLKNNVSFLGYQREVRSLLHQSDIYVCASNYESSPVSIWEAMSMELPIVSTDVGDLPEYIINDKNGYIVDKNDYIAMSNNIIKILSNKNLKNSMGKLNRTIAINNFSLDIVSKKTNNFYDQTINFKI